MAGYSGTPLPRKLGIKPNHRVALIQAPKDFEVTLGELPEAVKVTRQLPRSGQADVILLFVEEERDLSARFEDCIRKLAPAGGCWIVWPKKASGVQTDLSENVIRRIGLDTGLVDNKVCAVDDTWSALRFVFRLVDRPKKAK